MEVGFESNVSLIFDKVEKTSSKFWTDSNVNQEDYRISWCQYRNCAQENKENIDPVDNENDNEKVCVEELEELVRNSMDVPMEIVASLSACSIATTDASLQVNNSILEPPPVKRARIVKPPEAYEPDRKSTPKPEPFRFLARERENRERREARQSYYELLTKKSSPQPFKARPAPKFKPIPPTPTKFELRSATFQAQTPKASTSVIKSNILQPIHPSTTNRPSRSLLETPRAVTSVKSNVLQPISTPIPSKSTGSPAQTPQATRISRIAVSNKTPGASLSKLSDKTAGSCGQDRIALKRHFNGSNTPNVARHANTVQPPNPTEDTPRRRIITIPKSPKLSTAIRARERRQFEEMMQEKLRQRDAVKKMEMATNRQYEQERMAQLRKATVHKPVPLIKRPLTHPMLPVFVKRPRWV